MGGGEETAQVLWGAVRELLKAGELGRERAGGSRQTSKVVGEGEVEGVGGGEGSCAVFFHRRKTTEAGALPKRGKRLDRHSTRKRREGLSREGVRN